MAFHRVYLMWVLVCIPACRCLCSKPELIDISPQGFSLGIGHTFKTFPTQSVLVKSSVTDPDLLVATSNTVHMDKEDFPKILLDNACQKLYCDNMTMCKGNSGCVPVLVEFCRL
ncbi:uncharacterized protein LOC144623451 isoform X1 [Crassostrea virginica]